MLDLDRDEASRLMLRLESEGYIDKGYRFCKDSGKPILLGRGGFSYVYEMSDAIRRDRRYAAKVLGISGKTTDTEMIKKMVQTQYYLAEQSENILRIVLMWVMKVKLSENGEPVSVIYNNQEGYDTDDGSEIHIILMEKLDSVFEHDRYGNTRLVCDNLSTSDGVVEFAKQVGRALFAVHNNGYLHRDVKLENIFYDRINGCYKLGDFGLSRYVGEGDAKTVVFTDGYGAPEIEKRLTESYNVTADIYSFGVTLYLLLNDLKFPASDRYHVNSVAQYSADFIFPAPANASPEMAEIVRRMCSYRSADRYQSVEEVMMDIGQLDGSYTEYGFEETDEDFATEMFDEDDDGKSAKSGYDYSEYNTEYEKLKKSDTSRPYDFLYHKTWDELTYEQRKVAESVMNSDFREMSTQRMCIIAALIFALCKCFVPEADYVAEWQYYVLPALMLVEAVMQYQKEYNIVFGAVTCVFAVYSMCVCGIGFTQPLMILMMLLDVPAFTAGCALGVGLWIAQMFTGWFAWLGFMNSLCLGWLVIVALLVAMESTIMLYADSSELSYRTRYIWRYVSGDVLGVMIVMIVAGIAIFILDKTNMVNIPYVLTHMHLVRVGVALYIMLLVYGWLYVDDETENSEEDDSDGESVDD